MEETKEIICVCGPSYCGKTHFINTFYKDEMVFHIGDYFRSKFFNKDVVDPDDLAAAIKKFIFKDNKDKKTIILDNPFKNINQAIAVLDILKGCTVCVYIIYDKRTNIDITSRNRSDDKNIESKQIYWDAYKDEMIDYLKEKKIKIIDLYNTDYGWLQSYLVNEYI